MKRLLYFALAAALAMACNGLLLQENNDEVPAKPLIETGLASGVTAFTATLSGYANPGPELGNVRMGIVYSTDKNPSLDNGNEVATKELDGDNMFTVSVKSLSPNTTYYYKSFIEYGDVYRCGEVKSFTTLEFVLEVETCHATNIGTNYANINGQVKNYEDLKGLNIEVSFIICAGTESSFGPDSIGMWAQLLEDGSFTVRAHLQASQDYMYVACAKVLGQESYGEIQYFRTLGPDEGTSEWSVIGYLLGRNWDRDFVMTDEENIFVLRNVELEPNNEFKLRKNMDWSYNLGGTFKHVNKGFGVEINGANIKPNLYGLFDIYYNPDAVKMAVCESGVAPDWDYQEEEQGGGEENQEEDYEAPITIDGSFSDWDNLDPSKVFTTLCGTDTYYIALTKAKVYADQKYIYVYFEWDKEEIVYDRDTDWVPFHCYINTDGNPATGGYADLFSDACSDLLLEGFIYPNGELGPFDPAAFPWEGDSNDYGWWWGLAIIDCDSGLGKGAGVEGKYEFSINRSILAEVGYPIADVFSIGFDIEQYWSAVGTLPNENISEDNPSGRAPSLRVETVKP